MRRRSFRSGLLAGVFTGVAIALVRLLRSRRERLQMAAAPASAWPRVVPPEEAAEPGMEAPAEGAPAPGVITTQPAGRAEPMTEPAERAEPEPAEPAVAAESEPTTVLTPAPLVEDTGAPTAVGDKADTGTVDAVGAVTEAPAGRAEPLAPAWVEPGADGCSDAYPVKVKLASGIFHVPGGLNYARCKPDRCYASEAAAEADGFTKAKR